ncbi:MAG: helix-turn-helix transcriptional regulator [Anaerolineae bacterium]|nr:helix-turn-helix transcriptional regulator [Anaerolineae bacterium]
MYEPQPNRQKKEWADMGEIIGQSYEHRLAGKSSSRSGLSLGRYLQASRQNAGLTVAELAHRAKLPSATLLALERGLFDVADIQPKWLKRLAAALGEDVEDFHLLLGNPAHRPSLMPDIWDRRFGLSLGWMANRSRRSLMPIYALGSALLICFAFVTFISYPLFSSPSPSSEQIDPFIHISSERRLNMVKAENLFEYQVISLPPTHPVASSPK